MKRPPIDLATNIRLRNEQPMAFVSKFIQYWGTEFITDPATGEHVEVFKETQEIYPSRASNPKLFKLLNQTEAFKNQKYKGIKRAWLYLNPAKAIKDISTELQYIIGPINEAFDANAKSYFTGFYDTVTISNPDGTQTTKQVKRMTTPMWKFDSTITIPISTYSGSTANVLTAKFTNLQDVSVFKEELKANYSTIWSNQLGGITSTKGLLGVLSVYAPFQLDSKLTYDVTNVVARTEVYPYEGNTISYYYLDVQVSIIISSHLTATDTFIQRLVSDYSSVHESYIESDNGNSISYSGTPSAQWVARELRGGIMYSNVNPDLWVTITGEDKGGDLYWIAPTYRLKAAPFKFGAETFSLYKDGVRLRTGDLDKPTSSKVPALKGNNRYPLSQTELKMAYLTSLIDSDYKEKDCDILCKITTIAIVVIVVYVATQIPIPGAGELTGAALTAYTASAVVAYTYIGLTLAAKVAGDVMGNYALAFQLQGIAAAVKPLAQLAGVVMLVITGLDVYSKITTTAENTLLSNGIEVTVENVFDEIIQNTIPDMIKSTFTNALSTINLTVNNVLQKISMFADMYYKNQYQDAAKKYKKLSDEAAELDQILKQERGNPELGMQIANSVNMPLDVIQSPYDMEYYYMPTANNIQACYVRALIGDGSKTYNEYSCKL